MELEFFMAKQKIILHETDFNQMNWKKFKEEDKYSPYSNDFYSMNSSFKDSDLYQFNIDNEAVSGQIMAIPIDDYFYAEYQDFYIKKEMVFYLSYDYSHLEFNFPLEGSIEAELNKKYMNSKGNSDLFSLIFFNQAKSIVSIGKGQRIRQISFNLHRHCYPQQIHLLSPLINENFHLYKVSGNFPEFQKHLTYLDSQFKANCFEKDDIEPLLYEIIESASMKISGNKGHYACMSQRDYQTIKNVRHLIDKCFLEEWSLAEIGKKVAENEYKLKKGFREVYGQTIFEAIREKRMKHAIHLISSKKYTLEKVAYMCGYNNYAGFYKSFKRHFGCTPTEWLKSV